MMISTRDLAGLPDVGGLRRLMRSLAMLDAILCRDWEGRYFSFSSTWGEGSEMGSMRNGQGDQYFCWFGAAGCWMKGFDHEAVMSPFLRKPARVWDGVLEGVPAEFGECMVEPAFVLEETTFCMWRRQVDSGWRIGPVKFPAGDDPDGSAWMLRWLDGNPETYAAWAREYYEREVSVVAVEKIYQHRALDAGLVAALSEEVSVEELAEDVREIGYPER